MTRCATCGNDYDKTFDFVRGDHRATYDSFECAIHGEAPRCAHCGCVILGHGVESEGWMFCCAHCAEEEGVGGLQDRV
jgi:hypothetical protein